jgi:hypothetical protein
MTPFFVLIESFPWQQTPFRVKNHGKNLEKLLSKEHKMFLSDFAAYLKPQQNWHCPNVSDIQSAFASDIKDAV